MTVRIKTVYVSDGEFYKTMMIHHNPGYEFYQLTEGNGPIESDRETIMMDRDQAIKYAKAILRNEGIHAID